jgi:hypothetical protein
MIDVDMLDTLARGGTIPFRDGKWITLDKLFERVVTDGWHPRNPAFGAELDRLTASMTRGDCINPLLQEGDIVYYDPYTPALPGDIVSFRLSKRGAEAQNSDLPSGQRQWSAGDSWCKLYARYHGFDMLLDRHGNSATATLMACEFPDDSPVLHPVRQILRDGKLLFPSAVHCSDLGANAATDTGTVVVLSDTKNYTSIPGITEYSFSSLNYFNTTGTPVVVEVTASGVREVQTGSGTGFLNLGWTIAVNNLTAGGTNVSTPLSSISNQIQNVGASTFVPIILESEQFDITVPAFTEYSFTPVFIFDGSTTFSVQLVTQGYTLRIAAIKK